MNMTEKQSVIETWMNWKNWYYAIGHIKNFDTKRKLFTKVAGQDKVCNTYEAKGYKRDDPNTFFAKTHKIGNDGISDLLTSLNAKTTKDQILKQLDARFEEWLEVIKLEHGQKFIDDNAEVFQWKK
jgi:hypothetical protein